MKAFCKELTLVLVTLYSGCGKKAVVRSERMSNLHRLLKHLTKVSFTWPALSYSSRRFWDSF